MKQVNQSEIQAISGAGIGTDIAIGIAVIAWPFAKLYQGAKQQFNEWFGTGEATPAPAPAASSANTAKPVQ